MTSSIKYMVCQIIISSGLYSENIHLNSNALIFFHKILTEKGKKIKPNPFGHLFDARRLVVINQESC